jgi:RNA polymerase sigma-70 factor, ECF subfamily
MIAQLISDFVLEEINIKAAKNGNNEAAMASIYQSYFGDICQFIQRRVGDVQLAEDLASEVFLKLIKSLGGQAAPNKSLRAWIYRVARNVIHDYYADEAEAFRRATELGEWIPSEGDSNPEVQATHSLTVERARKAMSKLAPAQQEVLLLRFEQGLNLQETAERMGKNVNAIKALQFRAISLLRSALDKQAQDYLSD